MSKVKRVVKGVNINEQIFNEIKEYCVKNELPIQKVIGKYIEDGWKGDKNE